MLYAEAVCAVVCCFGVFIAVYAGIICNMRGFSGICRRQIGVLLAFHLLCSDLLYFYLLSFMQHFSVFFGIFTVKTKLYQVSPLKHDTNCISMQYCKVFFQKSLTYQHFYDKLLCGMREKTRISRTNFKED